MPITPPQVRVPTTGPSRRLLIAAVTMSPSEPANSSVSATTGPRGGAWGVVFGRRAPRPPPPDPPGGRLLRAGRRDGPAAIAADVHDERVADHLRMQVAVEIRPALAHHVRNVQVADPAAAELADPLPPPCDPVLVAQPPVVLERHHHGAARGAARRGDDG